MRRVAAVLLATCVLAVTLRQAEGTVRAYTPQSWAAAVRRCSAPRLPCRSRLTREPRRATTGRCMWSSSMPRTCAPLLAVDQGNPTGISTDSPPLPGRAPPALPRRNSWCGHCQRLAPVWEELGGAFAGDSRVTIGEVDCTTAAEACQDAGVRGYPTLKSFRNGQEISVHEVCTQRVRPCRVCV
jgi:hypothetical protein